MPAAPKRTTAASRVAGEPGNTAEDAAIAAEVTDPPLKTELTAEPSLNREAIDSLAETQDAADMVVTVADLKAWAEFERERNRHSRLGGNIGGSAAIRLDRLDTVVGGLELFVAWIEAGKPGADTVLSPEDKEYWLETRRRKLPIPPHVAKQLPPE